MDEIGIDISGQGSKKLGPFLAESFDWLITVCDEAREACPTIPGVAQQAHWSIEDPSGVNGDEATRLRAFRAARDELADRINAFVLAAGRTDPAQRESPPAG
jgi:arsenate reductase